MKRLLLTSLVLAPLFAACSSSNPAPAITDSPTRHDAAVSDATAADAGPPDASPSCLDPTSGCFDTTKCTPQQLDDFLNACTDVPCQQFDNASRLPLYNNGDLPPLPP